jgi:hypothetical protein
MSALDTTYFAIVRPKYDKSKKCFKANTIQAEPGLICLENEKAQAA